MNSSPQPASPPFQQCQSCGMTWPSSAELLGDPEVLFKTYVANQDVQSPGLLVFTHLRCQEPLMVELATFRDLTVAPLRGESCSLLGRLEQFCLATGTDRQCPPQCVCFFVDHLVKIITHCAKSCPQR